MSESQTNRIFQYLATGKTLTPLEAISKFGCMRLASRIDELRAAGIGIRTEMTRKNGKRYATYSLIQ